MQSVRVVRSMHNEYRQIQINSQKYCRYMLNLLNLHFTLMTDQLLVGSKTSQLLKQTWEIKRQSIFSDYAEVATIKPDVFVCP